VAPELALHLERGEPLGLPQASRIAFDFNLNTSARSWYSGPLLCTTARLGAKSVPRNN
jgi:hypothetical protein